MAQSKTVSGAEFESGFADHPEHKLNVASARGPYTVHAGGALIARSNRALILTEADYPPVIYFEPDDVDKARLRRTDHTSWCPFKGRASYYAIGDDPALENAVWTYEDPFAEVGEIAGYFAFYPNKTLIAASEENDGD